MFSRTLTSLAFLCTLGAASAGAQASPTAISGALVPAAPRAATGSATVRIQTLAWTDIQVPARLLAASVPVASARPSQPLWFTLTWQPAPPSRLGGEPASVAIQAPRCMVMRLVAVPCE